MVDEYQDTNYIQERVLDRLSEAHGNLCVVGDEDQALYRFRGATVRNFLEFPDSIPERARSSSRRPPAISDLLQHHERCDGHWNPGEHYRSKWGQIS